MTTIRADKAYSTQLERRLTKLPQDVQLRLEAMIVTLCGVNGMGRESALDVIFKMFRTMRDQKREGQRVAE